MFSRENLLLAVIALILISCGVGAMLLLMGITNEGGTGACYVYTEPLELVTRESSRLWDTCFNPETEQYVQCVPIEMECE